MLQHLANEYSYFRSKTVSKSCLHLGWELDGGAVRGPPPPSSLLMLSCPAQNSELYDPFTTIPTYAGTFPELRGLIES